MFGNLFGKKNEERYETLKGVVGEGQWNENLEILKRILGNDPHPQADVNDEYLDASLRNDFILFCEGKQVDRDPSEFAKFMPQLKEGRR